MALALSPPASLAPTPPSRPFTDLPDDILHLLLQSLHSFTALRSLLLTSPIFPALLAQNPTTIYTQIAGRHFPPSAFALLDLWRPAGLSPFQRRYVTERTSGLLSGEDCGLAEDKRVVGVREVERMVSDGLVLDKLVDWCLGVLSEATQTGVYKHLSAEVDSSSGILEIPLFDMSTGRPISAAESARVRVALVNILRLLPAIHSKALAASDYASETSPTHIYDVSRALLDYSLPLSSTDLTAHLHMLAVCDILSSPALPLFTDMQLFLSSLLWDRAIDLERVYSDERWELASLVEYVRAGALADRWQDEVGVLGRMSCEKAKGFVGGLNWARYERREITTQAVDGAVVKKPALICLELDG